MILVKVPYPGWAIAVGVLVTLFPIMFTPAFGCYYFVRKVRGTASEEVNLASI